MDTRPLNGVRVLDLSNYFAGPFCTMVLAGLGAEVIQVERPGIGNPIRNNPPLAGVGGVSMERKLPEDMSMIMLKRGRNKKSVTLDIGNPRGNQIFLDLAKVSDVVIENFSYGRMERLKLSYDDLKKVNPAIIYCSISGFGREGSNRERVAYDIIAQAMSGFMDITGFPDGPPTSAGVAIGDAIPALNAVIGIVSALYHKKQTGVGQKIDISMQDCLLAIVFDEAFDVLKQLGLPGRVGNRFQRLAPYNSYQAKDGYFVTGVIGDDQFNNLLKAIGREDLIGDPRYDNKPKRVKMVDELDEIISEWAQKKDKEEAVNELLKMKVPAGPVMDIDEIKEDTHLKDRKMVVDLIHPTLGVLRGVKGPGFPIKLSECPHDFDQAAPLLGADNRAVYGTLLGFDEGTLDELERRKII
jgi:crotonobetainyl-CoA:carnitine CoA-transferase CaiB-like acyl-CoA transferase